MYSAGNKIPESTGDKLPESTREWLHWSVWYSAGEQSYIKTVGDAC